MIAPHSDLSIRTRLSLLGVSRTRFAQGAEATAALFAVAFLVTIGGIAAAHANAALARRAVDHHVRDGDGHLLGEPAALLIAAVRLEMLVHAVDALDDDLVLPGNHAQHG